MRCSLRRGAKHKRGAQQTLNLEGSPSGVKTYSQRAPFLLPMSPVHSVTHVSGPDPQKDWSGRVDLNHRPPGPEPHE
jgi:hypothetical protein